MRPGGARHARCIAPNRVFDRKKIEKLAELYGGIPILGCAPGSPAELAGLRVGDILCMVNGVPTPELARFHQAKKLRADGMSVRVMRNGRELEFDVKFADAPVEAAMTLN